MIPENPALRRWHGVVLGEPSSKANSRRLVIIKGRPRFIKSVKSIAYVEALRAQVAPMAPRQLLRGTLKLTAHIYYASRRPDLDPSLILDGLQGLVYTNDRQVREQHLHWHLDRDNPRAAITVEETGDDD